MENLAELFVFAHVVESRGFTAASRRLELPKSTVSKRVADLERRMGVSLIARSPRAFRVTDIGAKVYEHAKAMIVEAHAATAVAEQSRAEPAGIVRLTASAATCQSGLNQILPRLAEEHPKIQVILHATNRYVDLVTEGFDLAVRAHYGALNDSALVQRRLGTTPAVLVASPRYLERHGVPSAPADLLSHFGLLTNAVHRGASWSLQSRRHREIEIQPQPRLFADEPSVLISAAVAGLGIAALPLGLCHHELESGALTRLLPDWNAGRASLSLLTAQRRGVLPSVRAVHDYLVAALPRAMRLQR